MTAKGGRGADLIIWVNVETTCCSYETFIRFHVNDTLIKNKRSAHIMQVNGSQLKSEKANLAKANSLS